MRTQLAILATLLLATVLAVQPARSAVDPSCKPVLDAMRKQLATPTHSYTTEAGEGRGGKPVTNELIRTGNAAYIQVDGKWRRSRMTVEDMRKQQEENLRTTKSMTCRYLRDEAVGGEAAAVYSSQADNRDVKSGSTVWISKRTGLPLKSENNLDTGDNDKQHLSIRYDYANVAPPAGVR